MIKKILLLIFFVCSLNTFLFGQINSVTDINISIIRLDYLSYEIIGYYNFKQTYRKSLTEENYIKLQNIFYQIQEPSDFGFTDVINRLSGEKIFHASTVWAGSGYFEYPSDTLFSTSFGLKTSNAKPDSVYKILNFGSTEEQANTAWDKVYNTDIIEYLNQDFSYEVYVFDHYYAYGVGDPNTAEWIIIAFDVPSAPMDIGLLNNYWPMQFLTQDVEFIPEITAHNFSDTSTTFSVKLEVEESGNLIYSSTRNVQNLLPDSSYKFFFEKLIVENTDMINLDYLLVNENGQQFLDTFSDNNQLTSTSAVTAFPVFRPVSTYKHPGIIPMLGKPFDFDNDGDLDVISYNNEIIMWQNNNEYFVDVTEHSKIPKVGYARNVIVDDFNGDTKADIIIIQFEKKPYYYVGDGQGSFIDYTNESGLSAETAYFDLEILDIENDGDLDLIFQSYTQDHIYLNNGSGIFNLTNSLGISNNTQTQDVAVGDLNSDGFTDIIFTNWGDKPKVYLNNKQGSFNIVQGPWDFIYGDEACILDYNNDGYSDILFARRSHEANSVLYKNDGNLNFEKVLDLPASFGCDAADINGDGFDDIVLEDLDKLLLLINNNGTFENISSHLINQENEQFLGLGTSPGAKFVDFDNDGDLDIYSLILYFENQGFNPTTVSVSDYNRNKLSNGFFLRQNYPNPFNPTTIISYKLPENSFVSLKIYDALGAEVKRIVNEFQSAGNYKINFNGYGLSSGIYFYVLNTGSYKAVKKMLLIK